MFNNELSMKLSYYRSEFKICWLKNLVKFNCVIFYKDVHDKLERENANEIGFPSPFFLSTVKNILFTSNSHENVKKYRNS